MIMVNSFGVICLLQFKVLRGGCWQKINFVRAEAEARADEDLLANPWFLHFRSAGKPKDFESPIVQELDASLCEEVDSCRKKEMTGAPATCSKQFRASHSPLRHQDMVGSNTGALSYTLVCLLEDFCLTVSRNDFLLRWY